MTLFDVVLFRYMMKNMTWQYNVKAQLWENDNFSFMSMSVNFSNVNEFFFVMEPCFHSNSSIL